MQKYTKIARGLSFFRGTAGDFGFILLQVSKDRYNCLERKIVLYRRTHIVS